MLKAKDMWRGHYLNLCVNRNICDVLDYTPMTSSEEAEYLGEITDTQWREIFKKGSYKPTYSTYSRLPVLRGETFATEN